METGLKEINKGWEDYYISSTDKELWKANVEPFLLENFNTIVKNKDRTIKVLDVGCGDGRNSFIWLKKNDNFKVCCLDIAKSGLTRLAQKAEEENYQVPILLASDFLDSRLLSNNFDVVQCFDALAQINNAKKAIFELCRLAKKGGYVIFNYFTPGDCAYGEGEKIDEKTFTYKDTLFKFMTEEEIIEIIPDNMEVLISETRRWDDPPHGDYRPYPHTHEAAFFLLQKIDNAKG